MECTLRVDAESCEAGAVIVDHGLRTVVLVEGVSDKIAVDTLAARRGRSLEAEGVAVVSIGGAKNIRRSLDRFGPKGLDVGLAGLCDAGEERDFARGLEHAGFGVDLDREGLAAIGFQVCVADLEDELIRALGPLAVERVIEEQAELASLRILQRQPAQRGRTIEAQLRRFIGTRSGRKARYARALVEALDLAKTPEPLDGLLAHL
jgi:hypothetical protein